MPGYKKKADKESKTAQRKFKREKRKADMGEDTDDFNELNNQLISLGLVLKPIPGDGNCLYRALGDQLEGTPDVHMKHREDVVQYMLAHREDFEPFVEDDISFDQHIRNISEVGTFGGNDSIVAFARLHDLTVVIHQLDKPLWQIHGGREGAPGQKEAHISYHNGDHYNSVRRSGGVDSPGAAGVRLSNLGKQSRLNTKPNQQYGSDFESQQQKQRGRNNSQVSDDSGEESDYENYPSSKNLDILVEQVSLLTGVCEESDIISALENNNFNIQRSADHLSYGNRQRNRSTPNHRNGSSALWRENGTGSRIIGNQVGENYRVKPTRNKNLSNKRQKDLKKRQQRLEKDTSKKEDEAVGHSGLVPNLRTLTI